MSTHTDIKVQEAMDQFTMSLDHDDSLKVDDVETCLEMFADYLMHYSDLFQDEIEMDDTTPAEWEAALEGYIEKLFDGDMERPAELGGLLLSQLDGEHIKDFLGWYLLREPAMDSLALESFAAVLHAWVDFILAKAWLNKSTHKRFVEVLNDVVPESSRASKVAHLLLYFVRLGGGVSPRLRGKRFDKFAEGHARIDRIDMATKHVFMGFDNQDKLIGPVNLPLEIISYLCKGDVLDVELGKRGGQWIIVDIGPVYPACVYVAADELQIPDKLT
ncbi:MAG: hypothetical protein Q9M20_03625 [Mariprofundaceae bacterium]|nr:hypothetical protein [Mariprofundaceae bacterium]